MPEWKISEDKPVQQTTKRACLKLDGGTTLYVECGEKWKSLCVVLPSETNKWEGARLEEMLVKSPGLVLQALRNAVYDLEQIVNGEGP